MLNGKSVLAVVPARGGSQGIKRKNIRHISGQPLIYWTISEAHKSRYIDRVILSSEDVEIIKAAKAMGCDVPFMRPPEMAENHSPGIAPVLHALENLPPFDIVVLLQPTSPLRTVQDIDAALKLFAKRSAPTLISVTALGPPTSLLYHLSFFFVLNKSDTIVLDQLSMP